MRRTILPFLLMGIVGASRVLALQAPPLQTAELGDFPLESGETLLDAKLGYRTAGTLDAQKSNAILFPTWFTGTSEDLFTTGSVSAVDTAKFFLVAVDAFGNGVSSSPSTSVRQKNGAFPRIGVGDMVKAQHRLLTEVLGIERLHAVMGISMGGMQTFEWLVAYPAAMKKAVPIVGSPRLGSYDLLLWRTELEAIDLAEKAGLIESAAPVVGMVSALALQTPAYHARATPRDALAKLVEEAKAGAMDSMYDQRAQLQAMIGHDVSRAFGGSMAKAAAAVSAEVLTVVGLHDHMVTPGPALEFSELLGQGSLALDNDCGHIPSLCEGKRVEAAIRAFLER
ncbi:MAG TPA: alpha/beta fold hydrolase [Vicinamibacteria bacterium]|nr:alpha/beta fold hydrolase [Vicinamibacteria bacterium]